MDPRRPELAVSRIKELIKQYDRIESDMRTAVTSAQLSQAEREGGLVIQEICLVAPRIHEAMMQTSRQRRHDLSRGILIEPQDTAAELPVEKPVGNYVDIIGEENIGGESKSIEKSVEEDLEKYGPQIHDYNSGVIRETLKDIEKKTAKKTTKKTTKKKAKK